MASPNNAKKAPFRFRVWPDPTIKHAVWAVPVPPVTTVNWDQEDWDRYADRCRPKDYTGDRYDQAAWRAYVETRRPESDSPESDSPESDSPESDSIAPRKPSSSSDMEP